MAILDVWWPFWKIPSMPLSDIDQLDNYKCAKFHAFTSIPSIPRIILLYYLSTVVKRSLLRSAPSSPYPSPPSTVCPSCAHFLRSFSTWTVAFSLDNRLQTGKKVRGYSNRVVEWFGTLIYHLVLCRFDFQILVLGLTTSNTLNTTCQVLPSCAWLCEWSYHRPVSIWRTRAW